MLIPLISFSLVASIAFADSRLGECARPEKWAAGMAQAKLKNAGLLVNEEIDFSKTSVALLASEKKAKGLYHQIQKIVFVKKNGEKISVITENDASKEECSMSGVTMYLVSKELSP
jgi:hypothetical protein